MPCWGPRSRVPVLLGLPWLVACASSRAAQPPLGTPQNPVSIEISFPQSMTNGRYPILADSGRQAAGRLGDPDAPACPDSPAPDTGRWRRLTAQRHPSYVADITVLLPDGFDTLRGLPPSDIGEPLPESGPRWGYALGSWWLMDHYPPTPGARMEAFAMWIGPDSGYPEQSVSPAPTQVSLQECQLSISGSPAHVVIYDLRDSAGTVRHNVAAYWKIKEKVWVMSEGDEPAGPGGPDFLFVLRSLKVKRP